MATMPSPARPVASSTSEAGSGTAAGGTLAFAVAGKSIPSTIQYTDFINPPYYFRRRMMATIPSPAKPVARSTREAGSGTTAKKLASAVTGKSIAINITYADLINPPCGARQRTLHYTWKHDSYHECKILKTNLLFFRNEGSGCGRGKISYTRVVPLFWSKTLLLSSKILISLNFLCV